MKLAYIAAPLFSDAERSYNEQLREILSEHVVCYLPQQNGVLLVDAVRRGADREQTSKIVFGADIAAIRSAQMLIAVLDGGEIDAGVAFEIGFAWSLGKKVFGLRTDTRRPISGGLNPMIEGACYSIATTTDELLRFVIAESETTVPDRSKLG